MALLSYLACAYYGYYGNSDSGYHSSPHLAYRDYVNQAEELMQMKLLESQIDKRAAKKHNSGFMGS